MNESISKSYLSTPRRISLVPSNTSKAKAQSHTLPLGRPLVLLHALPAARRPHFALVSLPGGLLVPDARGPVVQLVCPGAVELVDFEAAKGRVARQLVFLLLGCFSPCQFWSLRWGRDVLTEAVGAGVGVPHEDTIRACAIGFLGRGHNALHEGALGSVLLARQASTEIFARIEEVIRHGVGACLVADLPVGVNGRAADDGLTRREEAPHDLRLLAGWDGTGMGKLARSRGGVHGCPRGIGWRCLTCHS